MKHPHIYQDLQSHTRWSDGKDLPINMIEAAYEKKLHTYGITDHFKTDKISKKRFLTIDRIRQYVLFTKNFQSQFPDMKIVVGLEIDTSGKGPGLFNMSIDEYPLEKFSELDYLLMEHVKDDQYNRVRKDISDRRNQKYEGDLPLIGIDNFLGVIQKWRDRGLTMPIGLAHNSIFENLTIQELEKLARADIFIELCSDVLDLDTGQPFYMAEGYPPYLMHFINAGGKISIGSDAHEVAMVGEVSTAVELVTKLGIEDRVIQF